MGIKKVPLKPILFEQFGFGGVLGVSWVRFFGRLGASWGRLGCVLGVSWKWLLTAHRPSRAGGEVSEAHSRRRRRRSGGLEATARRWPLRSTRRRLHRPHCSWSATARCSSRCVALLLERDGPLQLPLTGRYDATSRFRPRQPVHRRRKPRHPRRHPKRRRHPRRRHAHAQTLLVEHFQFELLADQGVPRAPRI